MEILSCLILAPYALIWFAKIVNILSNRKNTIAPLSIFPRGMRGR
ncbi:hypothetical protein HMPREF1988_00851 [Porphyromonas gingivalis F0185]|nr:hypothetical protein HMPREF1553_01019 [Porphyromonas gingivalis F0568]ERJ84070.1 hypothetical protein HMPREF1988_00851 [Porphyromonas gingivalis F0185]